MKMELMKEHVAFTAERVGQKIKSFYQSYSIHLLTRKVKSITRMFRENILFVYDKD